MSRSVLTEEGLAALVYWINEREAIRLRKEVLEDSAEMRFRHTRAHALAWDSGMGWSLDHLTHDPILHQFRFTCVRRQDDRVTRWIVKNILEPYVDHPFLLMMACWARTINWPDTLRELMLAGAWPDKSTWSAGYATEVLNARQDRGNKIYTGVYMIRSESDRRQPWFSWRKNRYISEIVLGKIWERRQDWLRFNEPGAATQQQVWEYLLQFTGWGPFMAGQAVADLAYTPMLSRATDMNRWTPLGPGSRRGLNRLYGRPLDGALSQEQGLGEMLEIREMLQVSGTLAPWVAVPDLQSTQSCLCEADKFLRVKNGEGRPRSMYVPGRGS